MNEIDRYGWFRKQADKIRSWPRRYVQAARDGRVHPIKVIVWWLALVGSIVYAIKVDSLLGLPMIALSAYLVGSVDGWHCTNPACDTLDGPEADPRGLDRPRRAAFEDRLIVDLGASLAAHEEHADPTFGNLIEIDADDLRSLLALIDDTSRPADEQAAPVPTTSKEF